MELSISNVVNIQVSEPGQGVGEYNTSNLAIFTAEPYESSFGADGYKIYLEPTEVAEDFGTDSKTYAQALAVFGQQPNILANNGYLVVIPLIVEVQTLAFNGVAASGDFKINFGGDVTAQIDWDDTASEIQTKIRTITGLELATVSGSIAGQLLTVTMKGYYGPAALMTITDNDLATSAPVSITVTVAEVTDGESIAEGITRTEGLVQYFGLMGTDIYSGADMLAAAAVIQTLNKIGFFVQSDPVSIEPAGDLDDLRAAGYTQSRGLFYGEDSDNSEPLDFQAAYAGRALSTNFNGSNTTQTMHLKTLRGVLPDDTMTQTLLNKAIAAGADTYDSFQGVPGVFCSGENSFFDDVYNLRWFVGALQVAGFNLLAQTSTKIAQTEGGVSSLKSAYRQVCEQAVTNQFVSPGQWTSPTTFGNQQNFFENISQRGYYIYSQPVADQNPATRATRQAPLIQIAVKYAGAIHKSTVIVNVNP